MRVRLGVAGLVSVLLSGGAVFGQTAPASPATPAAAAAAPVVSTTASGNATFDVASVKPSAPLDMQKLRVDMQAGRMPNFGMHLTGLRAEYNYVTLRDLITYAYKVKTYQVSGPDWLNSQHFDIVARMPEGSTRNDEPKMLQALLAERFKLVEHRETQEHSVLALVVGKGGPKLKESPGDAPPIDEDAELKPGEMKVDTPDGPGRMTMNKGGMGATYNMGARGTLTWGVDMQTMTFHVTSDKTTLTALADMLTQIMAQLSGAAGGAMGGAGANSQRVVDMTGLKGNYAVAMDFSMADAIARAQAGAGNGGGAGSSTVATDPGGGGQTVSAAIEKLGLKLEPRKAPVEQIIVDHAEKTPTEN